MANGTLYARPPNLAGGGVANPLQQAQQGLGLMQSMQALRHAGAMNPIAQERAREALVHSRTMNPLMQQQARSAAELQGLQLKQAQLEWATNNAMRDIAMGARDPQTGAMDYNKFLLGLASNRLTALKAPEVATTLARKGVLDAQAIKETMLAEKQRVNVLGRVANGLVALQQQKGTLSKKDIVAAASDPTVQRALGGAGPAAQFLTQWVPYGPNGDVDQRALRAKLVATGVQGAEVDQGLDRILGEFARQDMGGYDVTTKVNPITGRQEVVPGSLMMKTPSVADYAAGVRAPQDVSQLFAQPGEGVPETLISPKDLSRERAKQKITYEQELPTESRAANYTLELLKGLDEHPGLEKVTGMAGVVHPENWWYGGSVPGTEAANARTRLAQLEGRAFLQAFETLKGGGHITEIEGEKATRAIARLDTAQSLGEMRKAIRELQEIARKGLASVDRRAKRYGVEIHPYEPTTPAPSDPFGLR